MKKSIVLLALAALLAFALPLSAAKAQDLISLQEAISIAQSLYPSAKVITTELVQAAQPPYYTIGLDNGRSVQINAISKEILQIVATERLRASGRGVPPMNVVPVVPPPLPPQGGAAAAISYEQALQIAQSRFPGAQPVAVELERKGRKHGYVLAWEIKLSSGYEVTVNALDGTIVEIKPLRRLPYVISPASAAISQAQAEQIAVSNFGGNAVFSRLHQEGKREGYALVWEVTLSNGLRVKVNATTGAVLRAR